MKIYVCLKFYMRKDGTLVDCIAFSAKADAEEYVETHKDFIHYWCIRESELR